MGAASSTQAAMAAEGSAGQVGGALQRLRRASSKCAEVVHEDGVWRLGAPNEAGLCTAFSIFFEYSTEEVRDLAEIDELEIDEISLAMTAAFNLRDRAVSETLFGLTRLFLTVLLERAMDGCESAQCAGTHPAARAQGLRAVAGFLIQVDRYILYRKKVLDAGDAADGASWFCHEDNLRAAARARCGFCGLCGHDADGCVGAFAKNLAQAKVISLDANAYAIDGATLVMETHPFIAEAVKRIRGPRSHPRASLPTLIFQAVVSP